MPHVHTFSTLSLDLHQRLTDFCHPGPGLSWAAWGRMAGLCIKKVNKGLTGTLFLKFFPHIFLCSCVRMQNLWILLHCGNIFLSFFRFLYRVEISYKAIFSKF